LQKNVVVEFQIVHSVWLNITWNIKVKFTLTMFNSIYTVRFKKLHKKRLTTKSKELMVDLFKGHMLLVHTIA